MGNLRQLCDITRGNKTGQMLLYKRTRHERRGNIKRKRDLVKQEASSILNTRLLYVCWKGARINSLDSDSTKMEAESQNDRLVQRLASPMSIQTAVLLVWTKVRLRTDI